MLSNDTLSKLAWLEKKATDYLDTFIDSRLSLGDEDVTVKRFPGHVAWAHQYNLRDYIGRSETAVFDFINQRPYLWYIDNGNVTKVPPTLRDILRETAIFMQENGERNDGKNETKLVDVSAMLQAKSLLGRLWPAKFIKSTLLRYPELFKEETEDAETATDAAFSCLVTVADGSILPRGLTSSITDGVAKALAVTPLPSAAAACGAATRKPQPKASASKGENGNPKSLSEKASKSADEKSKGETLEGVGVVVSVMETFGFLTYKRTYDVIFHWTVFDVSQPTPLLPKHVKVGDRLAFKAYPFIDHGVRKWRASFVSKNLPTAATSGKPKSSGSTSDDGWKTARSKRRDLSSLTPVSRMVGKATVCSDDGWSEVRKETVGRDDYGSRRRPFSENAESPDIRVISERELLSESEEDVVYIDMWDDDVDKQSGGAAEEVQNTGTLETGVSYTDVAVQTDVTEEEILLRLLRTWPQLLDSYDVVRHQ